MRVPLLVCGASLSLKICHFSGVEEPPLRGLFIGDANRDDVERGFGFMDAKQRSEYKYNTFLQAGQLGGQTNQRLRLTPFIR